jgi:S-DNA-T family DNA segregation ATPase FtsK/SpoIIIE
MVGGQGLQRALTRLLQRGRGAGIHVVAATQKPTAAVLGSLVQANFPVRLVGRVASANDARVASGWSGTGAERLEGRGDFVAVAEGRVTRFQAAYVAPEEIRRALAANAQGQGAGRWVSSRPVPDVSDSGIDVSGNGRRRSLAGQVLVAPVGGLERGLRGGQGDEG